MTAIHIRVLHRRFRHRYRITNVCTNIALLAPILVVTRTLGLPSFITSRAMENPIPEIREQICGMCADASVLFTTAHIPEAMLMWHDAVRRLLPLVTEDLEEAPPRPVGARGAASEEAPAQARLLGAFVAYPSIDATPHTSNDRTFSLYASAIQYLPPLNVATRTLEDDVALAAAAVYNLGLCHHFQALLSGDRAARCYAKAVRAYDASQRLLEDSGLCFRQACWPPRPASPGERQEVVSQQQRQQQQGLVLLQLALANNIGHVYDQIHSHDDARQQLEILHCLVAALDMAATTTTMTVLLGEAERLGPFLLTAVLYPARNSICHHAPSA
jgi:hypothetical protein